VRRPPESVTTNYVQIPRAILEQHQLVMLAADVMFVNGVPFLVSVARGLNLVTTKFTPSCTAKQLAAGITRMIDLYARGGFQVGTVLMDNEFKKLRNLVPILAINTTAAREHVPEVERKIRLIKERGRGILNTLPFKKMPRLILIELIYHVVLWLNAFPAKSGVSETLSPRSIVYRHKDFAKHCKSPFGTYCEVHDDPTRTNTMATRSTPATVLGPTGNLQGTYKFLNLARERRSSGAGSRRIPCRTRSSRRSKRMATRPPSRVALILLTGMVSSSSGMRRLTSSLKGSSRSRMLSSTLPSPRNIQEWCSGEINPYHRLRRSSSPKAKPKMPRLAMPTSSRSTSQEWRQHRRSYTPTRTNSRTMKLTMTMAS
jgi:hypothetical protein